MDELEELMESTCRHIFMTEDMGKERIIIAIGALIGRPLTLKRSNTYTVQVYFSHVYYVFLCEETFVQYSMYESLTNAL